MAPLESARSFFRNMWSIFFFALKMALGLMIGVAVLRFLNSATLTELIEEIDRWLPIIEQVETAVRVIVGFFLGTWGLRFLDNVFLRNRIRDAFALVKGKTNPLTIFTYAFVHDNDTHLESNTLTLLLYAGTTLLMLPNLQLFVFVTLVILIANALGILAFGPKTGYVGASGLLLGYFSFFQSFGLAIARGWQGILALVLLLIFGPRVYRVVANRSNPGTFIGHLWGVFSGLIAARLLAMVISG